MIYMPCGRIEAFPSSISLKARPDWDSGASVSLPSARLEFSLYGTLLSTLSLLQIITISKPTYMIVFCSKNFEKSLKELNRIQFEMSRVLAYLKEWEYLRRIGLKTIDVINASNTWEYRLKPKEFSVRETFRHTIQSIFEDAGNWFLDDSSRFQPSEDPYHDLHISVDRMINAIKEFNDTDLEKPFTFPWGERTTVENAIQQNLFHAIGHFSQLRERTGVATRT